MSGLNTHNSSGFESEFCDGPLCTMNFFNAVDSIKESNWAHTNNEDE